MDKSEPNSCQSVGRKKILFLAWGYSIHAQRRIQIFVNDPLFEVTIVSTFNYQFSGKNYSKERISSWRREWFFSTAFFDTKNNLSVFITE
jgi:hypothetical protein